MVARCRIWRRFLYLNVRYSFSTNDASTNAADIIVGNGGLMIAGTQTLSGTDSDTSKFAIGRLQYDQIFSSGFE